MTGEPRPIRDILAEMMRRERRGLVRPLWVDLQSFADDECEQVRRRADHLIRLLESAGVRLVCDGELVVNVPAPTSPIIYRYAVVGRQAERLVRRSRDGWEIVTVEGGKETIEQTFTAEQAHINGGLVLTADPAAKSVVGLGSQLAAMLEIYRLDAAVMEPVK